MILIDTNVISEMMKSVPDSLVINWIDQQDISQLFISTITIAEISYGLHALPQSKRRDTLEKAFKKVLVEAFANRVLTFDEAAAHFYGEIMGHRKEIGHILNVPDGQIAAIARTHGACLATRNVRDFKNCGLQLINPFLAENLI